MRHLSTHTFVTNVEEKKKTRWKTTNDKPTQCQSNSSRELSFELNSVLKVKPHEITQMNGTLPNINFFAPMRVRNIQDKKQRNADSRCCYRTLNIRHQGWTLAKRGPRKILLDFTNFPFIAIEFAFGKRVHQTSPLCHMPGAAPVENENKLRSHEPAHQWRF